MSIEEKYDEVRQLISIGKEKGYLLYDEVNELLPADITSSDELDDLFSTFGSAGIEVVDSEKTYREEKLLDRTGEGAEELELDLTPGALDKTNDPVRMYLREMGTVPLLTREGEVEIAKRIERGKLAVIKSISRTPTIAREIMRMGDELKNDERSIRELVTFVDEELTDEKIDDRKKQVLRQIDNVRKAWQAAEKCKEKLDDTAKGVTTREKKKYRKVRWESMRAQIEVSHLIRKIEFTETIKRRMIDQIKDKVEAVMRFQRQIAYIERQLTMKNRRPKLKDDERKNLAEAAEGAEGPGQHDGGGARREARAADAHARDHLEGRGAGRAGEEGAGRGQPPPRRLDRQEVHQPRAAVPRPDPGRQHRPDEGGRQVRVPPRLQVLDLRDVVDPPGDHPRDRRPGAHHPHPGPHDRDDQQADSHLARAGAGARPRADLRGDRAADGHPASARSARSSRSPRSRSRSRLRSARRRIRISATSSKTARWCRRPTR